MPASIRKLDSSNIFGRSDGNSAKVNRDGNVEDLRGLLGQVWQHEKRRGPGGRPVHVWGPAFTFNCPLEEDFVSAIRRRRKAVPNPSVTQVAWSHDGSKVVSLQTWHTIEQHSRVFNRRRQLCI